MRLGFTGLTLLLALLLVLSPLSAWAEYRVFRLRIANSAGSRDVLSTLDQYQYPEYYALNGGEELSYVESWMCWGRHGDDVAYCPNPKSSEDREPAAANSSPPKGP